MDDISTPTLYDDGQPGMVASDLVRDNLTDYSREIIKSHFPSWVDGLKIVHRRFLWTVEKSASQPRKSDRVVSDVKQLHDHSPEAIYGAVTRISQEFQVSPAIAQFYGNNGKYADKNPAAARYTELGVSPFGRDVFYKNVDRSAIPKQLTKDLSEYEPKYYIPAIPVALLLYNKTVGYGSGSLTVPLNLGSICDLVTAYSKHYMTTPNSPFDLTPHAEKLLPDFPIENTITNHMELLAAYKKGNFKKKICIDGSVTLTYNTITIRTIPFMMSFGSHQTTSGVEEKLQNCCRDEKSWFSKNINTINDVSPDERVGCCIVGLKRGVNVFEAWEKIQKVIGFSGTCTPNPNYVAPDGYLQEMSPANLISGWFAIRVNVIMASKRRRLADLTKTMRVVEARLIVGDHTDDVIKIIRGNSNIDAIRILSKTYKLSEFQSTSLVATTLSALSKDNKIAFQEEYKKLLDEISKVKQSFSHIAEEISEEAQRIKRQYAHPRITKLPKYIGYIAIGTGCIQFEDKAEIPEILENFPKGPISVHMYDGPHLIQVDKNGRYIDATIPKVTTGDIYGLRFEGSSGYTVNIVDGAACCVRGIVPGLRSDGYFYTTKKSKAFYRSGAIRSIDVPNDIALRKTICRGTNTDLLYVYPDLNKTSYVILFNDTEPNTIILQRVAPETSSLIVSPVGSVEAVHSFTGKDWYFSIPDKFLSRCAARVFCITDAELILKDKKQLRIDVNSHQYKKHPQFKMFL